MSVLKENEGSNSNRKWGNSGGRRRMGGEQSQNLSLKSSSEAQESGAVAEKRRKNRLACETAKVGEEEGGTDGGREMLSWMERSQQTVRGPEGDTLGALCSVAAPGPCFEATPP